MIKVLLTDYQLPADEVATHVSQQSSDYQAEFFNVFFERMDRSCRSAKGSLGMGFQLLNILKKLDVNAESTFAFLTREVEERR